MYGINLTLTFWGKQITLNHIEHEILRKQFNEPRIHMALVCASISCPPLRNEPFTDERLEEQLEDQSKTFLMNKDNFTIDSKNKKVVISSIFNWFGKDFEKIPTNANTVSWGNSTERAIMNFIINYLSEEDQSRLKSANYTIAYAHYDWGLNGK